MTVTHTPGALEEFCRTQWQCQETIEISSFGEDRERFASDLAAVCTELESARVTIDQIVFPAERLTALCPAGSPLPLTRDSSLSAARDEMPMLFMAAFYDLPDFILVPTPKPFAIYADHDQWVTFYANTKSNVNQVVEPLVALGHKLVKGWRREL